MSIYDKVDAKPGEARCPGPSTKEIILSDGQQVPPELLEESYEFMGDQDIPYERYTSKEFFEQEMQKVWPKVWQWACREEHIPEPGDFYVYDIGYYSILVVRTQTGDVKAYHNACLHRGTQLRIPHTSGSANSFRCPFHGWEWNLDGSIKEIPCRWDFPKVEDGDFKLPEVKVGRWGGFIFINMDENAQPLEDYLEILPRHFANWPLEERHVYLHVQKILPANWKASQEAFVEAYHSLETHWQAMPFSANLNAQYDVFGENVTRFVHTFGHPDISHGKKQTQQELLDNMGMVPPGTKLPEGAKARAFAAQHLRETMGAELGVDLSKYSDSEMLDSIEYHLFPNAFLFPGVSLPMVYRFRPNGRDPDTAIFDLLFMRPTKPGEKPEAPEPVKIDIGTSYTEVPGMSPFLGEVYDQDTGNLERQQNGFYSSAVKRGQTLGNYQEIRLRNIHKTLDKYLNA